MRLLNVTHLCMGPDLCAPAPLPFVLLFLLLTFWGASYLLSKDKLTPVEFVKLVGLLIVFGCELIVIAHLLGLWN